MSYKSIDDTFWTDPKIKKLSVQEKLLVVYLITNPHSHYSGLYYLPEAVAYSQIGVSLIGYRKGMDTLFTKDICRYDKEFEMVWVVKMAGHQLKNMNKPDKVSTPQLIGIANHLETLHNCPLIKDFLEYYNTLSIPYLYPITDPTHTLPPTPTGYKDEDKDEDEDEDTLEFSFKDIWKRYPNKDGRKKALVHFNATVKRQEDWNNINKALDNYLIHLKGNDWKSSKNGSSWFNNWHDWIEWKEPENGSVVTGEDKRKKIEEMEL